MSDSEFLQWIHNRLVQVHNEHEFVDYMWRLRDIIARIHAQEVRERDTTLDAIKRLMK